MNRSSNTSSGSTPRSLRQPAPPDQLEPFCSKKTRLLWSYDEGTGSLEGLLEHSEDTKNANLRKTVLDLLRAIPSKIKPPQVDLVAYARGETEQEPWTKDEMETQLESQLKQCGLGSIKRTLLPKTFLESSKKKVPWQIGWRRVQIWGSGHALDALTDSNGDGNSNEMAHTAALPFISGATGPPVLTHLTADDTGSRSHSGWLDTGMAAWCGPGRDGESARPCPPRFMPSDMRPHSDGFVDQPHDNGMSSIATVEQRKAPHIFGGSDSHKYQPENGLWNTSGNQGLASTHASSVPALPLEYDNLPRPPRQYQNDYGGAARVEFFPAPVPFGDTMPYTSRVLPFSAPLPVPAPSFPWSMTDGRSSRALDIDQGVNSGYPDRHHAPLMSDAPATLSATAQPSNLTLPMSWDERDPTNMNDRVRLPGIASMVFYDQHHAEHHRTFGHGDNTFHQQASTQASLPVPGNDNGAVQAAAGIRDEAWESVIEAGSRPNPYVPQYW